MDVIIVLPIHLFESNDLINNDSHVYIYEHPSYFTNYDYHKLKLILHRSTMKFYYDYINNKHNCQTKYLEYTYDVENIFKKYQNKKINIYDPVDHDIMEQFNQFAIKYNIDLVVHDTLSFIEPYDDLTHYYNLNAANISQTSFYIWQRKRYNILVDKNQKPINGKWTFDKENREPYSKEFNENITDINFKQTNNKYVQEAVKYVNKYFKNNPGSDNFYLPNDFTGAKKHLTKFIKERLDCFGPYQDTVSENIVFGCHSVLSPLLNTGLLTPTYVIERILDYYEKNKKNLNFSSVEGIVRQIIGWRSWMRYNYMFKHKELINDNYFNHTRKLDKSWYTGKTGIVPIDDIIMKVLKYGYAHHIERLMYIGNFMLLSQIHPKEVYKWFQSLFIDSYTVFMETNVYGMSQYSCGPLLVSRPYFSSSNYIDKMSSYTRKPDVYPRIILNKEEYEWYEIWDALYYNFIKNNKLKFKKNYSTARSVGHWDRKSPGQKRELLKIATNFLY